MFQGTLINYVTKVSDSARHSIKDTSKIPKHNRIKFVVFYSLTKAWLQTSNILLWSNHVRVELCLTAWRLTKVNRKTNKNHISSYWLDVSTEVYTLEVTNNARLQSDELLCKLGWSSFYYSQFLYAPFIDSSLRKALETEDKPMLFAYIGATKNCRKIEVRDCLRPYDCQKSTPSYPTHVFALWEK